MCITLNEQPYQRPSLLNHTRMQLTMKAIIAGVVPLLLAMHCRMVCGKALLINKQHSPMCQNVRPCEKRVFNQIRCQISQLNTSAKHLFDLYLKCQGKPFTDKDQLDGVCSHSNDTFPHFSVELTHEKEILVALYKIFVFFNASLGNITRDQTAFYNNNKTSSMSHLLERLNNTANVTSGLLSNLSCLLCSEEYKVSHVDVIYGKSSAQESKFQQRQQGCQVLRWYRKVISRAAETLGKCH